MRVRSNTRVPGAASPIRYVTVDSERLRGARGAPIPLDASTVTQIPFTRIRSHRSRFLSPIRHMPTVGSTLGPNTSSQFRAIVVPAERRWRATLLATIAGALVFFIFEASKSAIFPHLTIWESHNITITFGSLIAGGAAWFAMARQASMLRTLAAEEALRERLEIRQRALAESEMRYRQLMIHSPEAIVVHRNGRLIYANDAAMLLIGAKQSTQLLRRRAADFVHPDDLAMVQQRLGSGPARVQYRLVRLDGGIREVEAVSVSIAFEGTPAMQTLFRDVTERKELEARLLHGAFHDALTGLANRALFRDRLEHALTMAGRDPDHRLAVLFLDLDDFKGVNDSLGHEAGDQLLHTVSERIVAEVRASDTVARFGGDEFAVLLERLPHEAEALAIVNRIEVALRRPLMLEGRLMSVATSVGVAYASAGDDVDTLLRNADVAMYEAKEAGKARHAVFEPSMYAAIVQRLQLETDVRAAASAPRQSGLHLAYQPIVDLRTGAVRGLEALLRWEHPHRGTVEPSVFVPVAEHTGAIVPLGRWVLEEACQQLVAWRTLWWRERRAPDSVPGVSVNISGRQLAEDDFVDDVAAILRHTGAPAGSITLEITESVIMRNTESSLRTLSALKALGLRLAIDDFGTGYSSLSYLQKFPVDVLKIDRAFVEGVAQGGSDTALARTIVTLGNTLSLRTVAEGVESPLQRDALSTMGCVDGQGYLFSPPRPAAEITGWLRVQTGGIAIAV